MKRRLRTINLIAWFLYSWLWCGAAFAGDAHAGDAHGPTIAHGEMYAAAAIELTVDAADTPHVVTTLVTGHVTNVTFTANDTGAITAYADGGGGEVDVTTGAAHGLVVGDTVNITDSTNYNGVFAIVGVADTTHFSITATWNVDDGASNWKRGDRFVIIEPGDYRVMIAISAAKGAGTSDTVITQVYVDETAQAKCRTTREIASTDIGAWAVACFIDGLAAGDEIFFILQGDNADELTTQIGTNFTINKVE